MPVLTGHSVTFSDLRWALRGEQEQEPMRTRLLPDQRRHPPPRLMTSEASGDSRPVCASSETNKGAYQRRSPALTPKGYPSSSLVCHINLNPSQMIVLVIHLMSRMGADMLANWLGKGSAN